MDVTDFLSKATYVVLPKPSRPKVYLCIASGRMAKVSFELYNPFSAKAKTLKCLTQFLCVHCNSIAKKIVPSIQGEKSDFMDFLEHSLSKPLISSLYISTAKDKVVLQLQDDIGIIGYLKYPISPLGKKRLTNESKAIDILSKKALVPEMIQKNTFNNVPFIIVKNLKGTIGEIQDEEYQVVLSRLKKDRKFKLAEHPRTSQLINRLAAFKMTPLLQILEATVQLSQDEYFEVYEHGDFAPWNLIRTEDDIVPFDLEYFEETGLEYLDEIKYHFQIQHLLAGKKGKFLVDAVLGKLNFIEAMLLFQIFLLKEIVNKMETDESYDFEQSLLHLISDKKSTLSN